MKRLWLVLIAIASSGWVQIATGDDAFLKALQDSLHKLGDPWIAGSTSVSHLSWEEKQKLCGCIVPTPEELANDPVWKAHDMTGKLPKKNPPESWDWRDVDGHDWMTQPQKQGMCGNCWAFGMTGMFEARIKIANDLPDDRSWPDLSQQFLTSCNIVGQRGCAGGRMDLAAEYVVANGLPDEACFPYTSGLTGNAGNCNDRCSDWQSRVIKPNDWAYVSSDYKDKVMEGPLDAAIYTKEDFFYYKGGVYEPVMGKDMESHALVLCGWRPGEWLYKNSYGTDEEQFIWISQAPHGPAAWLIIDPFAEPFISLHPAINEPNDNVWDPGETVTMIITLKNYGPDATNVTGELSTTDSHITDIVNKTFNFGNIPKQGAANNSANPVKVTASSSTPYGYEIPFTFHLTGDGGYSKDINFTAITGFKPEFEGTAGLYGMTFDGTYLWATDADKSTIMKLNAASGNIVGEIPAPGGGDLRGIAWDKNENVLWVHRSGTKKIYKISTDGTVLKQFSSPATVFPTGLAFDGTNLWAVDLASSVYKIFEVDTSGNKLSEFTIPIPPPPLNYAARGLAFEPSGPNGGSLLLIMTHFHGTLEEAILDSTTINEITRSGSIVSGHQKRQPPKNGRAIAVHPYKGKYWVNVYEPGPKVYRIDGFYEVGTEEALPERRSLSLTISPNPSQHKTSISFSVPNAGKVNLNIYDIAGKLVCRLIDNKVFQHGNHKIGWNGKDKWGKEVPKGIYFYRLESGKSVSVKKIILLK